MEQQFERNTNINIRRLVIELILMAFCFGELLKTDSFYFPYLVFGGIALLCLIQNSRYVRLRYKSLNGILVIIFSVVFSLMITLSNYEIWAVGGKRSPVLLILMFLGAYIAAKQIFVWLVNHRETFFYKKQSSGRKKPIVAFLIPFAIIAIINLAVLFLCKYPGVVTEDSMWQIEQTLTGEYSNHHPFYHTMIIKGLMGIGMALFHNINAAVAFYSAVQILFMAMCFAFAVLTLCRAGAPRGALILLTAFFALMPYHIMYSMSMWKDIMFGGMVLLFVLFLYRSLKSEKKEFFHIICLGLTGLGVCLLRSNGLFAFVGTTIVFVIIWKLRKKKILFTMIVVIVLSFVLKHPVLNTLHVTQPDFVESLSIPEQQLARDLIENDDFTEEELQLIDHVADHNRMEEVYKPWLSNPIKNLVRNEGDQQYLSDRKMDFAKLYISRSLQHPDSYVKAWIDQTRGYWNSGYPYWVTTDNVLENDYGIERVTKSEFINQRVDSYVSWYEDFPMLQIMISIGVFVWLTLIALFVTMVRRDKTLFMLTIPLLMIVFTLLISTPVYSEFRYSYSVFCTIPAVLGLLLIKRRGNG